MTARIRRPAPSHPAIRFHALAIGLIVGAAPAAGGTPADNPPNAAGIDAAPFTQVIPGTTVELRFAPIPAGTLTRLDPEAPSRPVAVEIAGFYMSVTEITWDAYDIFVFALDQPDPTRPGDADLVARPSKPYLPPDRGFGHSGYPALSMTHHAAEQFCVWLSAKTGLTCRLPTEDEWEFACRAGSTDAYCFGSDPEALASYAWHADSSEWTTHPVATLEPNAFGLYDTHGNAAEWANGTDGTPVVCGGSYLSDPADVAATSRERQTRDWQASDPQIPRSTWWLSDATHVGFRIVCEAPPAP